MLKVHVALDYGNTMHSEESQCVEMDYNFMSFQRPSTDYRIAMHSKWSQCGHNNIQNDIHIQGSQCVESSTGLPMITSRIAPTCIYMCGVSFSIN